MNTNQSNRDKAEKYFIEQGLMPSKEARTERWVLHHKDVHLRETDPKRYHSWNIEDLEPMTFKEHQALHMKIRVECGDTKKYASPTTTEKIENARKLGKSKRTHEWIENQKKAQDEYWLTHSRKGQGLGHIVTEETRRKMSENRPKGIVTSGNKGMHWFNNGEISICAFECPEGFVKGRLGGQNPYRTSDGRFSKYRGNQSDCEQAG